MNLTEPIAFIVIGLFLGFMLGWFLSKTRTAKPIMERDVALAALSESNRNKADENQNLKAALDQSQREIKILNTDLLKISEIRSAAESRLEHLTTQAATLHEREKEISALSKTVASLETAQEKERTAFDEKAGLLQELHKNLSENYKALSASALKSV